MVVDPLRSWTVLAYIVADDDRKPLLNPFASGELSAMKQAAIDEDIDLAAYVDFTGPEIASQRCFVEGRKGEDPGACRNTVEDNSATMSSLKEFLDFASKRMKPNSHIAMFLWGHGAGPAGFFLDPNPEPQKSLALPEMFEAFQSLRSPIEVMLFRDCWTANLELAYQFDGLVNYVIASQGLVPIPGAWPFRKLFQTLKQTDPAQPQQIAQLLGPLDEHYQLARNRGVPPLDEVRFTALNLVHSRATLTPALSRFVSALEGLTGTDRSASRAVMEHAKGGDVALVDVMTMCEELATFPSPVGTAAVDLHAAATQLFIDQTNGTPDIPGNSLRGVSLFRRPAARVTDSNFIESVVYDCYKVLPLCDATRWHEIAYETLFE